MGHYFENTSLTGVEDFLDFVKDQLVTEGWSATHVNTTTGIPASNRMGRTWVFTSNGRTGSVGDNPAHHSIFMSWSQPASNHSSILLGGWLGHKIVATGSISKTSNTVTVNSANHGLRVGDVLFVLGTGNSDFHAGWISDDGPLTVATVPDANTFTYSDTVSPSTISPTTFTNMFAIYNAGGSFTARVSNPSFQIGNFNGQTGGSLQPANLDTYGYCDEYGMSGVLIFGSITRFFYLGSTGRGHVPDSWQHCGALTTNVTGTGSPQVIQLDRSCPNMTVGQPLWFIPTNDSNGQKNDDQNSVSRESPTGDYTTASAKPSDSRVEVTLRSGDAYPPGTIVGFDPAPVLIYGISITLNTDLDIMNGMWLLYTNGVREKTIGSSGSYEFQSNAVIKPLIPGNSGINFDNELSPGSGLFYGFPSATFHPTSQGLKGARYPLIGLTAWGAGAQVTGDTMVVGADIAANRYRIIADLQFFNTPSPTAGNWILGFGPGAT